MAKTAKKLAKGSKVRKTATRSKGGGAASSNSRASAAGKRLVIVESPTKAKTINRYLGSDYVVMASVGHVRDLPPRPPKGTKALVPGVDLDNNFKPTYDVLPDKKKTVRELRQAAKSAEGVWFATDHDREGEAIAWHLAEALDVPMERTKRVVFNAITKSAIEDAFKNPRTIDEHIVNAQQARRILDRIVGYQVSPLLWKKVSGGLSAGRVQSVALRIVVERERQIEAFVPKEYWKINGLLTVDLDNVAALTKAWAQWQAEAGEGKNRPLNQQLGWLGRHNAFKAELIEVDGESFKCDQRDKALAVAERIGFVVDQTHATEDPKAKGPARSPCVYEGHVQEPPAYRVRDVETKRIHSRPSAPFITSTLQQAAANRFGYPLQRTMRVAQQLYEGLDIHGRDGQVGLITYMRTDSTVLTPEALKMARNYIQSEWGDRYLPAEPKVYAPSHRAQEAHEAIRPTDVTITPKRVRGELADEQFRLYQLIWERFLACQMTPAAWDRTTVLIDVGHDDPPVATLRARGRRLDFDGFYKAVGVPSSGSDEEAALLPPLEPGTPTAPFVIDPAQHFTNPPPRYNEASLQKKLEEEGIGRPSTYAQIIGTIQDRKYVEPVTPGDRRLRATDLGTVVTDMLVEAFPKLFMDVAYTSYMEAELDKIESEHNDWVSMLHAFYGPFKESLERAHEELTHAKAESRPAPHTCPKCGAGTEYRFGRNGRFLSCTAYFVPPEPVKLKQHPRQKFLLYKAKGKARPKVVSEDGKTRVGWTTLTPEQKEKFQKLSDKMPPSCDFAAPIDAEGNPVESPVTDILCLLCGGEMTKRSGRFGPFLGCTNYPKCKGILKLDPRNQTVVLPKPPPLLIDLPCPKCDSPLNLRRSKRGPWLSCSKFPKCRGRLGWSAVDPDKQKQLEQALAEHEAGHPLPVVRNTEGQIVSESYLPRIAGEEPSDAGKTPVIDSDAA